MVDALAGFTADAAFANRREGELGRLAEGYRADFVVLDPSCTPLLARRTRQLDSLEELLFALALLGDDRAIRATYSAGRQVHARDA